MDKRTGAHVPFTYQNGKNKSFLKYGISSGEEMMFCPNCGTKLILMRDKQAANAALEYQCPKCGYKNCSPLGIHEHVIKKSSTPEESIVVIDEKELELRTMPTSRAECPKCHNDLAYIWQVQTRAGDEGSTQFFRCTKCSHTWRLYT